jgi:hypothetical protein
MLAYEDEFGEPQLLPTDVQMRGCWCASFTSVYITIWYTIFIEFIIFQESPPSYKYNVSVWYK